MRETFSTGSYRPETLGTDKGYFSEGMIEHLLKRRIEPHIAASGQGQRQRTRRYAGADAAAGTRLPVLATMS